MTVSRAIRDAHRERVLDRLAKDAEASLSRNVEGRRAAGRRLLKEMHEILTKAVEFNPTAYTSSMRKDGSLVVGDAVTVSVTLRGNIRAFTAGLVADELPEPAVRFNARTHAWEHRDHPLMASPIEAILDVIQPVVLEVARQTQGEGAPPPIARVPGIHHVGRFRRSDVSPALKQSATPNKEVPPT